MQTTGPKHYNQAVRLLYLLQPKIRSIVNHMATRPKLPGLALALCTTAFLTSIHFLVLKILTMMDRVALIGLLLKNYFLSGILLCLLFLMVFSNIINALSAFFLSRELELVFSSPMPYSGIFAGKFTEVLLRSSWMSLLLLVPVLTAYGVSYHGGPLYYLSIPLLLAPFFIFCSCCGVSIALCLASVIPVRRAASVLKVLFILSIGVFIVLLRILQPEELLRPERFESFGRFLLALHSPYVSNLPSYWLSKILLCFMTMDFFGFSRFVGPYLGFTAAALLFTWLIAERRHIRGWRRLSTGASRGSSMPGVQNRRIRGAASLVSRLAGLGGMAGRRLIEKEMIVFSRSPVLWTQTALLVVIVVIYIYNIRLLPAEALAKLRADLPAVAAVCNVGFISFIVTAAALRFGFPSISMEGRALGLLLSSPYPARLFIKVKYWAAALPLTLLAFSLGSVSSYMLKSSWLVTCVVVADVLALAAGIGAMSIAFGVVYADPDAENFAELPSGWGGMLFMIAALLLTILFIGIQSYPCYLLFLSSSSVFRPTTVQLVKALACFALSASLILFTTRFSHRTALKRIKDLV